MGRVTYVGLPPRLPPSNQNNLKLQLTFFSLLPFLLFIIPQLHHYLPPLWFAVLMVGHLLDHFIFSSRRLTPRAKNAFFALFAGAVIATFWWFKGVSFGIDGPVEAHWGLQWRRSWNVSSSSL
jgi:dolichyl-phosphate-mannose-protein mannosyltransferase